MSVVTLRNIPFKPDTTYMEVPRCDTCRWWRREDDDGTCEVWRSERQKVWIDCGENTMRTAADFGCVQWEAKSNDTRRREDE